jgi:dynein heavy chain, axonemal
LDSTSESVKQMEIDLIEKAPLLKIMNEETAQLVLEIQAQALAMEPKKQQAMEEEAMVNERVQEAQHIKEDCEKDLSVAKPKLKQAEDALNTLDQNDINNIKAMLKPPETVRLVMEAVCVLCGVPAISIPNPNNPKERL